MDTDAWQAQRGSFGAAAALYDRVRPRYHEDAIGWALHGAPGLGVADLGAGTGILTSQLIGLGYHCTPVEPDPQMRARCDARLRSELGEAAPVARDGSAEAIPLPDDSVDAVVCGQAYHWFEPATAIPEIARVLRPKVPEARDSAASPGGVFAPIWNIRDEAEPWVAELTKILRSQDGSGVHAGWRQVELGDRFHDTERAVFRHTVRHTPQSLTDLLRSRSYYLTGKAGRRELLERDLRTLLREHPDLAGRAEFDLPYLTVAYRAHLKP